jgi:hypothetical protein
MSSISWSTRPCFASAWSRVWLVDCESNVGFEPCIRCWWSSLFRTPACSTPGFYCIVVADIVGFFADSLSFPTVSHLPAAEQMRHACPSTWSLRLLQKKGEVRNLQDEVHSLRRRRNESSRKLPKSKLRFCIQFSVLLLLLLGGYLYLRRQTRPFSISRWREGNGRLISWLPPEAMCFPVSKSGFRSWFRRSGLTI